MRLRNLIGPSPALYLVDKIQNRKEEKPLVKVVSVRSLAEGYVNYNNKTQQCFPDEEIRLDQWIKKQERVAKPEPMAKPKRMSQSELRELYSRNAKLTRNQKLVKSVLDEAAKHSPSGQIPTESLEKFLNNYTFRQKYKKYLIFKRLIPVGIVSPVTARELLRINLTNLLGMKSVPFTVESFFGFSLPAFLFFHMGYYYAPDRLKPLCQVGKWTLGLPFIMISEATDKVLASPEEALAGTDIPLDMPETGGTIPTELGELSKVLQDMKKWIPEKTY